MLSLQQISIKQLKLPRNLVHILHRNDVRTFGELQEIVNKGNLLKLRFVGKKLADEITELVAQISTQTDPQPWITAQSKLIDEKDDKEEIFRAQSKSELKSKLGHVSIERLEVPKDVTNALIRVGIRSISDLLFFSSSELSKIWRIGPKRVREIETALDKALNSPEKYIQLNLLEKEDCSIETASIEASTQSTKKLITWSEIIEPYFQSEKEARIYVLISRFGLAKKTLEEIASELGITRERVRQVQLLVLTRFGKCTSFSDASSILKKVIQILNENKDGLSLNSFRSILNKKNLLGKFSKPIKSKLYNLDPFDVLICWLDILGDSKITVPPVTFPIEIDDLRKATNISIQNYKALKNIPKINRKKLLRKVIFTGGIHFSDAKKILAITDEIARLKLRDLKLKEIRDGWFGPVSLKDNKNRHPLILAGNKILATVDEIEFSSFYDGLRRFSGRFFDSIAPEDIVLHYMKLAGFIVNDNMVSSRNRNTDTLSATENCFINTIKANGNVASFIEIAEDFRLKGFSIAAVSAVLARSPIVDKVDTALYTIRGCCVSWTDIENAKKRQKIFSKDAKVSYRLDGTIKYRITLNSWAVYTGVISTNTIKDLAGEWSLLGTNEKLRTVNMDEFFIFGLTSAISELQGNIGDRIELSFNTWNRTLSLQKVDHGDE